MSSEIARRDKRNRFRRLEREAQVQASASTGSDASLSQSNPCGVFFQAVDVPAKCGI